MLIQINHDNMGPFFSKVNCHRAANATVATGNQGHLVLQFAAALVIWVVVQGPGRHFIL